MDMQARPWFASGTSAPSAPGRKRPYRAGRCMRTRGQCRLWGIAEAEQRRLGRAEDVEIEHADGELLPCEGTRQVGCRPRENSPQCDRPRTCDCAFADAALATGDGKKLSHVRYGTLLGQPRGSSRDCWRRWTLWQALEGLSHALSSLTRVDRQAGFRAERRARRAQTGAT